MISASIAAWHGPDRSPTGMVRGAGRQMAGTAGAGRRAQPGGGRVTSSRTRRGRW